ncbi:MAG: response regulator [Acidobacteria bacterium]|nr:response regulator [Acidobacteriota bacterium]
MTTSPPEARTILLVDDDPEIRGILRAMLEGRGFNILEAPTAEAGRFRLLTSKVDLVFLDLGLPAESGPELCAYIKKEMPPPVPKVVMLTVHDEAEAWVMGLESGPDVYAVKPFGLDRILMLVDNLLGEGA